MIRYLDDLKRILLKYKVPDSGVCLVTSAVFAVKGIRNNHDIEFVFKPNVRKDFLKKYEGSGYNSYSGVIKFDDKIQCVLEPYRMFGISDEMLFEDNYSEKIEDFRIIKLELYLARKLLQNRKKDEQDICMVKSRGIWTTDFNDKVNKYLNVARNRGYVLPKVKREEKWKQIFDENEEIYIFGTGYVGQNIYKKADEENLSDRINGFLVSHRGNSETIFGKKIYEIPEVDKKNSMILIAVEHCNMVEIKTLLKDEGCQRIEEAYMFWQ